MTTLKLKPTVGADGTLRLEVPVAADGEYVVTVMPTVPAAARPLTPEFWDSITITDPAFRRYPLGPPRIPPPLDAE